MTQVESARARSSGGIKFSFVVPGSGRTIKSNPFALYVDLLLLLEHRRCSMQWDCPSSTAVCRWPSFVSAFSQCLCCYLYTRKKKKSDIFGFLSFLAYVNNTFADSCFVYQNLILRKQLFLNGCIGLIFVAQRLRGIFQDTSDKM